MTLTPNELERLMSLRQRTYDLIAKALAEDGHCKSYEGTWELTACWPDYFTAGRVASPEPSGWMLTLHCYLLGPHRHYTWHADTVDEVLEKGEAAIASEAGGQYLPELWADYPNMWCQKCDGKL